MTNWKRVLWAAMLVAALPSWSATAAAPSKRPTAPLDLTTSPLPITLAAKPGTTVTTSIKVKQSGGDTQQLQVKLLKFGASGVSGRPALSDRGPGDDYFDWVSFDRPTFEAPNDVWQTIKMTIKLPKSAAYEYNYAVVFSRVGDEISPGNNQEGIAGGSAVLVLMDAQVPGETRHLTLESFSVKHKVVEFVPDVLEAHLYNDGKTYIKPDGEVFITQNKHQVGTVLLNDEQGNILANSRRVYSTTWADGWPYYEPQNKQGKPAVDRHGNQITTLNWGLPTNTKAATNAPGSSTTNPNMDTESTNPLSRFRFGKYDAHLVVVYKDEFGRDTPILADLSFWVIPWRILLVFLALLLVFGFAGYSLVRSIMRRRRRMQRLKARRIR
jgi:hypothetical protein